MSAVATPGSSGNTAQTGAMTGRPTLGGVVPLPRGRRGAELIMLVFAIAVVLFAYASVGFGLNGKLPSGMITYGLAFAVIVGIAHVAVRRLAPWADPLLLPLAALLNGLGIVMIYRLQESGRNGNPGNPISTMHSSTTAIQVLWSAVGIAAFIAVLAVVKQPRMLQRYTYTFGAIGLVLLAIPAVLPNSMSEVNGAKVWISVGGLLAPARRVRQARARRVLRRLPGHQAGRALAGRAPGAGHRPAPGAGPRARAHRLGGEPAHPGLRDRHRYQSALFFGLFVVMLYIATQRTSWLLIGITLFVGGAVAAAKLFSHVGQRFTIWLHPFTVRQRVLRRRPTCMAPV